MIGAFQGDAFQVGAFQIGDGAPVTTTRRKRSGERVAPPQPILAVVDQYSAGYEQFAAGFASMAAEGRAYSKGVRVAALGWLWQFGDATGVSRGYEQAGLGVMAMVGRGAATFKLAQPDDELEEWLLLLSEAS